MSAPWSYKLPTALTVGGEERAIRTDYRVALDIFLALTDPDLDDYNKAAEMLEILYVDEIPPELWQEAVDVGMWFLNGGEKEKQTKQPKLVDWEQDFNIIAAPISQIVGKDIRGMDYFHWWSFLAAYSNIGDCFFAHVVAIRDKKAKGKKLDKPDREFYQRNREQIDIQKKLTSAEEEVLNSWL